MDTIPSSRHDRRHTNRRPDTGRSVLAAPLTRWWLFVVFVCGYLLTVLPNTSYPNLALVTLLPTSLAMWFGLMPLIGNWGERTLYDPVTLFNAGMFYYSLKGASLATGERTSFLSHIDMPQVVEIYPRIAILTALGIVVWNFGYGMSSRRQSAKGSHSSHTLQDRSFEYLNPRFGVMFLVAIGVLAFYLLIQSTGEGVFVFLLQSWRRGYLSDTALSGSSSAFASLLIPGMLLLPLAAILWLTIIGNNQRRPGIAFWMYTLFVLVALFLVMPRATVLGSILSLLFVYHYCVRPISWLQVTIFSLGGLIYAYAMGLWRNLSHSAAGIEDFGVLLRGNISVEGLSDFVTSGALADIRIFVLVAYHYGQDVPLHFGATLLRIVTQFIPRALWPAKPLDLGVELGRLSNPYSISGTPAGYLPEMYMNFHIVGVIVGAFVLGYLLHRLYQLFMLSREHRVLMIVIYAVSIPRILLLPSSTISIAFVSWAIPVAAAVFALHLCTMDKTSRRQESLPLLRP